LLFYPMNSGWTGHSLIQNVKKMPFGGHLGAF
jgi:hypothetical protein